MSGVPDEMVDIYICYEDADATRLVQVLNDNEVEALVRDRLSTTFPTTVGHTAEQIVAVPESKVEQAREAIRVALQDEVVSDVGEFV